MEPGKLNPVVVEAMLEIGIDISGSPTKSVFDMFKAGKMFAYVITVFGHDLSGQPSRQTDAWSDARRLYF
ncbi:MAG: hypothetical protein RLY20_3487 [Verrucomicrobiota bacterium]|jgi:hypothetical protein